MRSIGTLAAVTGMLLLASACSDGGSTPPPDNTAPTAGFTHSCNAVACSFTSTSTDVAPGTIATYAWTFGDGGTANVNSPSHNYTATAPTDYTVTLTVTDNEGATDVESQTVTVTPGVVPVNVPPTAGFNFTCTAADCSFTNTSSDVAPGTIATYAWTFGDGATADLASPSHSYAVTAPSDFTVTLTVTDNEGAIATATQTVSVVPANAAPIASFTPWCYGEGCIFTSHSTDAAPGTIVNYAWDFGDGATSEWHDWAFPQHLDTHVYSISARSTFTITLTVTDNEGATATTSQRLSLSPLPPAVEGCTNTGGNVECVLDITSRSTLKLKLLEVHCDVNRYKLSKLTAPPPVGDQVFLSVCLLPVGKEIGVFGGALDVLWVYQTGSQARFWFTLGAPRAGEPPRGAPAGRLTGTFPDWTLSFDDGDNAGAPDEPNFTDLVVGVHATPR